MIVFKRLFAILLVAFPASSIQQPDSPVAAATVKLHVPGSQEYGSPKDAPAPAAVLLLDSISFDGKSGMVKLPKGMTTMYLVVSNQPVTCEMHDTYDKKTFLRGNQPGLSPKLPLPKGEQDYVAVFMYQHFYNPRKVAQPPLAEALAGRFVAKDFSILMGGKVRFSGAEKPPAEQGAVDQIEFSAAVVELLHTKFGDKPPSTRQDFGKGDWVYEFGAPGSILHLNVTRDRPPFDRSILSLQRKDDTWMAEFDLAEKAYSLQGRLPVQMCAPHFSRKE
jgi:hypothetical protein